MTRDDVFRKFQDILVSEFDIDKELVKSDTKLYDDLELDSIDLVDILVKMKEHLKGNIEPEKFKKAFTIQDVVDILHPLAK